MNASDYQKLKDIFQSAVEIPPDERSAYLDDKCPDSTRFRAEIDRLLDSYDSGYLEDPIFDGHLSGPFADLREGHSIAHYSIVRKIGSGGMGEVYLAEDGKLGRLVAIKLLPQGFTHEGDRLLRFQREARAASALNHPNILTIYEIGEADSAQYIATEYIDGETLRARLSRGRLEVGEALDIAIQCASALAAAHDEGIIHRDIKPENIMLRRDQLVKVLDFGLAKLVEKKNVSISDGAPTERYLRTVPGMIMGTVQYMSPEQVRGNTTDARTDIWSLGVVIYEMIAGHPPFCGDNSADIIAEIVKSRPPILTFALSGALNEMVRRMLEKNAGERYQSARTILIELKGMKRTLESEKRVMPSSSGKVRISGATRIGQISSGRHQTAVPAEDPSDRELSVSSKLAEEMSRNSRLEAENEALRKDVRRQDEEIERLRVQVEELTNKVRVREAQVLSLNNSHASDERGMEMLRLELFETTKELNRIKRKLADAAENGYTQ